MRTVIFDLDGTMCDVTHRRKYVQHDPKNWDAFNAACVLDKPVPHVIELYNVLAQSGYHIIFCSGRGAEYWDETVKWLEDNVSDHDLEPAWRRLRMRAVKDRRPDNIVKKEMLDALRAEGYRIAFAVDDRNQVVDMWRENGVPCFQCAPGDF